MKAIIAAMVFLVALSMAPAVQAGPITPDEEQAAQNYFLWQSVLIEDIQTDLTYVSLFSAESKQAEQAGSSTLAADLKLLATELYQFTYYTSLELLALDKWWFAYSTSMGNLGSRTFELAIDWPYPKFCFLIFPLFLDSGTCPPQGSLTDPPGLTDPPPVPGGGNGSPVPEPASVVLALVGAGGVSAWSWLRRQGRGVRRPALDGPATAR